MKLEIHPRFSNQAKQLYNILTFTLLLLGSSLFISCSNSNDNTQAVPTLEGEWKLVNVSGGFIGTNQNFPAGQIKWTIDTANHTVTVNNTNTDPNAADILESGVYNYSLVPDPNAVCTQTININNMDLGCYTVTDTDLVISFEYADGFTLRLIR